MAQDAGESDLFIKIEPSASAFFAGEVFQARITLTNTRQPAGRRGAESPGGWSRGHHAGAIVDRPFVVPTSPPATGPSIISDAIDVGVLSSRRHKGRLKQIGPNIPVRDRTHDASGGESGERTPTSGASVNIPGGRRDWRMSTQSTRAKSAELLDGTMSTQEMVWSLTQQNGSSRNIHNPIPSKHQHARKVSAISVSPSSPVTGQFPSHQGTSSPPPTLATINENGNHQLDDVFGRMSTDSSMSEAPGRPRHRPSHKQSRQPSYLNAYGADTLGLNMKDAVPSARHLEQPGVVNILWAHTRIRGHFTPSSSYIPPDPLLPLRSLLLHQPLGSGSLMPADKPSSSNRWSLTFGSGTIGQEHNPSLTGSLVGLAKGLVWGGHAGTLEDERRKVWTAKALPVLETLRSLIGVDIRLKPGESRAYTYRMTLPLHLPPTFRGQALRFGYDLETSISVSVPGPGNKPRTREFNVPIKVWPHVASKQHLAVQYDVLSPIMQRQEEGKVEEETRSNESSKPPSEPVSPGPTSSELMAELSTYARMLEGGAPATDARAQPPPITATFKFPATNGELSATTSASSSRPPSRLGLDGTSCKDMVEMLSRNVHKISLEIQHKGTDIAQVTVLKSTYRTGEPITGVVQFVTTSPFRVLKFSAKLQSRETLPELLLPESPATGKPVEPDLRRIHSEQAMAVTIDTARATFSLDVPSEAPPTFEVNAANVGRPGGLDWQLRLTFLVAYRDEHRTKGRHDTQDSEGEARTIRQRPQELSRIASPLLSQNVGGLSLLSQPQESLEPSSSRLETVDCSVPVRIIPGVPHLQATPMTFQA